ncbi:MAG: YggS family pyridoxal phosphate-dependent enzyme [Treponema sp.]|nr:YggS family pyridoxal phosphate-dependent enzyme [Treponema sp.]
MAIIAPPEYDIAAGILQIREKINDVCVRLGRDAGEIRLMAVSKMHPVEAVEAAWKDGIMLFGENRVQEGMQKFGQFRENYPGSGSEVHFIGRLQRNKAGKAANFFDCIQSVDRIELIDELGALTLGRNDPLMVFLEYHTGEESKAGFLDLDSLFRAAEKVLSFPGLRPAGLMTIAPFSTDAGAVRSAFRSCCKAREELGKRFPKNDWSCLSMGMTGDFEIALEEGSNLIRIGTAIFGIRN